MNTKLNSIETYAKNKDGQTVLIKNVSFYERYIIPAVNKDGSAVLNKDGSQRYYPVDDGELITLPRETEALVKGVGKWKRVYSISDGTVVEKIITKDGKVSFYPVDESSLVKLPKDKVLRERHEYLEEVNQTGFVIVDETDSANPKIIGCKTFASSDHATEVDQYIANNF